MNIDFNVVQGSNARLVTSQGNLVFAIELESPPVNPDMVAKYREVYKEDHQVNLIDDQSTGIGVPNDSRKNLMYCVEIYVDAGKVLAAKKKRDGTGYLGTCSNSDKQQDLSTNVLECLW